MDADALTAGLALTVPFREYTAADDAEQLRHLTEDRWLYAPGRRRYVCSLVGAVHAGVAAADPAASRLLREAAWMARRMNDYGVRQEDLDWTSAGRPPAWPGDAAAPLTPAARVVCCCAGGKVRSVGAKYVLEDTHGFRNVLACGLEQNGPETLEKLFVWADFVLVVGEGRLWGLLPDRWRRKATHLDVGEDRYGRYDHPDLQAQLRPLIAGLVAAD